MSKGLAGAGAGGVYTGNLYRDLKRLFGWPIGAPPIDWIMLPTKTGGPNTPWPVIWPHRFFQEVHAKRQDIFTSRIVSAEAACSDFWDSMRHTDFVTNHPFLPEAIWPRTVPIGVHGDGGAFSKADSLYCIAWNSLVVIGPTIQTRFIFSIIPKHDLLPNTLDELLRAFSWSVNVLLSGETPHLDWRGRKQDGGGVALANGWRAVLTQARGDWEFYRHFFYFPAWNAENVMCPFCQASATVPERLWTHVADDAGWRGTKFNDATYRAFIIAAGLGLPILLGCVLGFRLECVMVDPLHTLDQGVSSNIIGSVFWYIAVIRNFLGGNTYDRRVFNLWSDLKLWYSNNRCTSRLQGELTKERVRASGQYPKLKAKAAATRHLAKYAYDLLCSYGDPTHPVWGEHDKLARALCQMLVQFNDLIMANSQFSTADTQASLPQFGRSFASIYVKFAGLCFDIQVKLYKLSPKLHLFEPLVEDQMPAFGNCRFWWTYPDEDLIGQLIDVAEGVHPFTLAVSVMSKWVLCVFDELLIVTEG